MLDPIARQTALGKPALKRAAVIAAIVGTLLACINHGDRMLLGTLDTAGVLKIVLTYFVPFSVSLVSSVLAVKDQQTIAHR
ncbi:nitrate/nitrite transporter NrtS [Roseibium sp.]|uniref:nitrate/nitrite transporter NrtS n=1 Tax=Roseibium sp. TaxID=1936156 RepID=UPI003B518E2E